MNLVNNLTKKLIMANCTVIKSGATISSEASERASKLKRLIDDIYLPYNAQKVGDIAMYDSVNDTVVFADADADFANDYPASQFTPIGVVAIPADHNTNKAGKNVVVSLKYMDCSNPDEGNVSLPSNIYWGYNNKLLGNALDKVVNCGKTNSPYEEAQGEDSTAYIPSDVFSSKVCPTDSKAYYTSSSSSYNAAPSPYLEDESKNPAYSQTTDPTSEANCLADFNGVGNTQLMLDNVTVEDWKTTETIANNANEGNYPAACVCWRYHTKGTNQGDWYLPACGELGYVMARLKTINASIANLITAYGSEIGSEISTSAYLWTSTEYSASDARSVTTSNGNVSNYSKSSASHTMRVRSLCRV